MDYVNESFIDFCDDMMIANEGFLESLKQKVKNLLLRIIRKLKEWLSKGKDNKVKSKLRSLLSRAERALTKTNNAKTEEDVQEAQEEAEDIKEEMKDVEKTYVDEVNLGEIKSWFEDKLTENKKGIIFLPTEKNIKRWNLKIKSSKNMLVQVVYDIDADKVVNYREISFSNLSPKTKEMIVNHGGTVVVEK